jgi:hypothetical protein
VEDELSDEVLENYTIKYQYADNGDVLMATSEDGEAVVCTKENSAYLHFQYLKLFRKLSNNNYTSWPTTS